MSKTVNLQDVYNWLGESGTANLDGMLSTFVDIANGSYEPRELLGDILQSKGETNDVAPEELRMEIDSAITSWLKSNGMTEDKINDLDYSYIDNELNDLLPEEEE